MQNLVNYYCDGLAAALGEFIDVYGDFSEEEVVSKLSSEELDLLCKYAMIKNKLAGIDYLNIKVPYAGITGKYFDLLGMDGHEIISAKLLNSLSTKDFVGGRLMLMIEDFLDYNEGFLSEVSDFLAKADMPVIISLGRDLEEVGRLVNRYGKSPVQILEDFGFLDRECYIYGLNFIDKEDQKLLQNYNITLIFSPRSDGEEGKGAINLYNFIYNHLKFVFSSGKCYNIDMPSEGKLAILNTNNLMYERGLVKISDVLAALQTSENSTQTIFGGGNQYTILDRKIVLDDENLSKQYSELREKVKEIVKKVKE